MAEVAVTAALVLVELVSLSLEKHNSRKIDIKSMHSWLTSMKAFMEDNCGREEGSRMLQDHMNKIRNISYDIEDVVDEFLLHSPSYLFHRHKFTHDVHNKAHQLNHFFPLRGISKRIGEINRDIQDIRAQLPLRDPNPNSQHASSSGTGAHKVTPLLRDDEMVGYQEPKTEFMRQLVDKEKSLLTLAVKGPRGSGKTTFVKNAFWRRETRWRFDCHAWVHVSRACDVNALLTNILQQLCGPRCTAGLTPSAKLRKYLSGKRYVVALDDVWKKEDWDYIKDALPNGNRGSRIIVTTSSSNLASICASSGQHVHSLENLEWLQGWKLFCRKAFPETNGECPADLKDSCVKIVKRCEGLPLAIVAVGSALALKQRRPNEWERFHANLGDEIQSGGELSVITNALLPTYMDLPTNLKCCFLYLSIFPEDYSVKRGRLLRLWVAERFALKTDSKTAEEVAEDYLDELIQRNLLHVSHWDFDGRPRNIRVLNLILEFIIQKCKDQNFASILPRETITQNKKIRRLSVHTGYTHLPWDSGIRSMFLFSNTSTECEKDLCKHKLLRVLDMQGTNLRQFPKDISRLTLLKFLSFRNTKIKIIPSSIKNLSHLETLDLVQTDVTELPKEISYLHNLCHLFVYKTDASRRDKFDSVQGAKVQRGIDSLKNLQDFTLVKLGHNGGILKDMKELTLLRRLGLTGLKSEHGKDLCIAVESMIKLTTLDLRAATKEDFLEVGGIANPPRTLQRLYLKGLMNELPRWISSLDNLLRVRLMWSKMEKSPLQALERLPHLTELHLVDCCDEEEMTFNALGFEKLKSIVIEDLTGLHTVVIRPRAMPRLKQMSIRRCPQLRICPLGLQYLTKLEELTLHDMVEEFVARIRMNGEDRECVRHVPVITHSSTRDNLTENLNSDCFSN